MVSGVNFMLFLLVVGLRKNPFVIEIIPHPAGICNRYGEKMQDFMGMGGRVRAGCAILTKLLQNVNIYIYICYNIDKR
jgi:hypothetical protein